MYTGNYYQQDKEIRVPHDYGGSAFEEAQDECKSEVTEASATPRTGGIFESIASLFPLGRILPEGARSALHLDSFKLGTEELLIISLALFLFLSKDGDKECAIILFLLLFIN